MNTRHLILSLGLTCLILGGAVAPLPAQNDPAAEGDEDVEKPKKKPAKKKKEEKPSKYRFTGSDPYSMTYRYDEQGNPVVPKPKKKKAAKKPVSSEEDEIDGVAPLDDCGEGKDACKE